MRTDPMPFPTVTQIITGIRDLAPLHHGLVTWRFSQCLGAMKSLLNGSCGPGPVPGLCSVLSARWITEYDRGGLETYLNEQGPEFEARVAQLKYERNLIDQRWPPPFRPPGKHYTADKTAPPYRRNIYDYIALHGNLRIPVSHNSVHATRHKVERDGENTVRYADRFAEDIARHHGHAVLGYIAVRGYGGGHAIAFRAHRETFELFDPNCGEFMFFTRTDFRRWLSAYMQNMRYFILSPDSYSINYYGPSIAPKAPKGATSIT